MVISWSVAKNLMASYLPQQRVIVSWHNLATIFLPALLGYYTMAVLVQLPRTKLYRLALLPAVVWSTIIAGMTLDFSWRRPEYVYLNEALAATMFTIAMRAATWTIADKPYVRFCCGDNQNGDVDNSKTGPSPLCLYDVRIAMWNACDLCFNLRGLGWNWSKGMHIPRPMFKTESRLTFAVLILVRFVLYTVALSAVDLSLKSVAPAGPDGWSIFDPSLPPLQRYLRSSAITVTSGFAGWIVIEIIFQFHAFAFTLLLQQQPSQWPPLFDHPWFATSLAKFWARGWHQIFREWFVAIGSRPLGPFLGPYSPIGAFVLSGIFHDIGLRGLDHGGDSLRVVGYFAMQGVGVALERLYKRLTGRRVDGVVGCLWMWTWQIVWGNLLVDAWAQRCMIARSEFFFEPFHPTLFIMNTLRWVSKTSK
ncbi:hypothetical protein V8B97DRAFT_1530451 [Scleroderma yunnanense]